MKNKILVLLAIAFMGIYSSIYAQKKVVKKSVKPTNELDTSPTKATKVLINAKRENTKNAETYVDNKLPKYDLTLSTFEPPEWRNYLRKKLQIIVDDATNNGCKTGTYVYKIQFYIDENGRPVEPKLIQGNIECNLGDKCLEVIRKGPTWPIARDQDGYPIKSMQSQVLSFNIVGNNEQLAIVAIKTHAQPNEKWADYFDKSIATIKKKAKKEGCAKGNYNVKINYTINAGGRIINVVVIDNFCSNNYSQELKNIFVFSEQLWRPATNIDDEKIDEKIEKEFIITIK